MNREQKTPADVWAEMLTGNERFIRGEPQHPRQDVDRRAEIAHKQTPQAALFGCSDSRLAAEIIFDKGLGDLFVVRNAGQIISDSVIGSLEYAVSILQVRLIVILGHDACGAILAAIESQSAAAPALPVHISALIKRIVPAVRRARRSKEKPELIDPFEVGKFHLQDTVAELLEGSEMIADAIAAGQLAIVGANYQLAEGRVVPDIVVGKIDTDKKD